MTSSQGVPLFQRLRNPNDKSKRLAMTGRVLGFRVLEHGLRWGFHARPRQTLEIVLADRLHFGRR